MNGALSTLALHMVMYSIDLKSKNMSFPKVSSHTTVLCLPEEQRALFYRSGTLEYTVGVVDCF